MSSKINTAKLISAIEEFINWHFTKHQIKCMMKVKDEKNPFAEAAVKVHQEIMNYSPVLLKMLEEFTPHPSCRFSLLREVFRLRREKELENMISARDSIKAGNRSTAKPNHVLVNNSN